MIDSLTLADISIQHRRHNLVVSLRTTLHCDIPHNWNHTERAKERNCHTHTHINVRICNPFRDTQPTHGTFHQLYRAATYDSKINSILFHWRRWRRWHKTIEYNLHFYCRLILFTGSLLQRVLLAHLLCVRVCVCAFEVLHLNNWHWSIFINRVCDSVRDRDSCVTFLLEKFACVTLTHIKYTRNAMRMGATKITIFLFASLVLLGYRNGIRRHSHSSLSTKCVEIVKKGNHLTFLIQQMEQCQFNMELHRLQM